MAVSTKKGDAPVKSLPKKNGNNKPRVKQVLTSPLELSWPELSDKALLQVKNALLKAASGMQETTIIKPTWPELRKVKKEQRKEVIKKYREDYLKKMSVEERDTFVKVEEIRDEKLSHMMFGYNQIMRALQRDEVAALLVNKSVTPEFLAMSFLPVCMVKEIPIVPLENLGQLVRKCIAIGLKKSVLSPDCCFHPLYERMVKVCRKSSSYETAGDESLVGAEKWHSHAEKEMSEAEQQNDDCQTTVKQPQRPAYPPPPVVDVSKYHLKRTRTTHRVFIPNKGINNIALMDDYEFIVLPKAIPELDATSDVVTSFSFRKPKPANNRQPRKFSGKPSKKEETPISTVDVSDLNSDIMFLLDVDGSGLTAAGGDGNHQSLSVSEDPCKSEVQDESKEPIIKEKTSKKRKLADNSAYVPAAVKRIVGNVKRKKK